MTLDWLLDPISEDAPGGPDLERADDPAFVDYYYEAESRMPERYFTPGMAGVGRGAREDQLFDPRSVDVARETATITALLRRSRDLRLLSLLARFQILGGRAGAFADTLEAIAALLAERGEALHPDLSDGPSERRGALEVLAGQPTVIAPLHHLPLIEGSEITFRYYQAAAGLVERRESEDGADAGALISTLRNPGNAGAVARSHTALARAARATGRIMRLTRTPQAGGFSVDLSPLLKALGDLQGLIAQARPDLRVETGEEERGGTTAADAADPALPAADPGLPAAEIAEGAAPDASAVHSAPPPAPPPGGIASRAEAATRLEAAERWLADAEPSSLALLLITQARQLIGKSLVEALEVLMPADAARAVISFSPDTGFALPMERLRALSGAAPASPDAPAPSAGTGTDAAGATAQPPAPIPNRAALAAELSAIESWFRAAEPASPIPILLARARGFLDRGFESILTELIPRQPQG
ncbi:MAG: type VI secretion system ImpA family N-terminal domain-containing protein [Paracoccus sp. (in: a-proteobacteria)]|nr:type VI secretion system ImpA family N-terminal domain-containing protein [Paracoccus sp. (in: a-proteobacteria)]